MRPAIRVLCLLLMAHLSSAQSSPVSTGSLCKVSGKVVQDPGQNPLKKVTVSLAVEQEAITEGVSVDGVSREYSAVTDSEGNFQINAVPPGDYRVALERNGFVS